MLRTAPARGGIYRDDLAGDEPIEQHAHRGQALLGGRRAMRAPEQFDMSADMQRLDVDERGEAVLLAPCEEFSNRAAIGARSL